MYQMSKALDMKPSEICAIETGRAPMPPDFIERAAAFLTEERGQDTRKHIEAMRKQIEEIADEDLHSWISTH